MAGHGALVLGAMLAIVAVSWVFIAMTDLVSEGKADHIDRRVIGYLRHHPQPKLLINMAEDITALGGPGCWLLVTGMIGGYLVLARRPFIAAWLFCTIASGAVVTIFLKGTIDRVPPGHPAGTPEIGYYPSYPSGHSMMAAMVYLTLGAIIAQLVPGKLAKLYVLMMAVTVTFLVGISRIYLCIHWPTDVLAGWAAGLVWALLCWVITERVRQIRQKRKLLNQRISI